MNNENKTQNLQHWNAFFLGLSILFGAVVRLAPVLLSDFPINDGGMFLNMVQDLQSNHYILPGETSYNQAGIPFAYPPFSFYVVALINEILNIDLVTIFRYLPALISIAAIPAFYLLAREITRSKGFAVLAALAFSLTPRTYSWFILGGGISRSFYLFFYLFAALFAYRLFTSARKKKLHLWLSILFFSLVVLSHPEAGLHAAVTGLLIWLYFDFNKRGLIKAALVAVGVLLVTALWWLPVLVNHGLEPFYSAIQTGGHSFSAFWLVLMPSLGEELFLTLFGVLALIGLGMKLQGKEYFLPLWFALPLVVEPRSGPAFSIIPLSIMAGIAIPKLLTLFTKDLSSAPDDWTVLIAESRFLKAALGYVSILGLVSAFAFSMLLAGLNLTQTEREAIAWIKNNTPTNAQFITLTNASDPFVDPVSEWFPALTHRKNHNTIQGQEWLLGKDFTEFRSDIEELQTCMNIGYPCVQSWIKEHNFEVDYIYVQKTELNSSTLTPGLLVYDLTVTWGFQPIFENENVVIFQIGN